MNEEHKKHEKYEENLIFIEKLDDIEKLRDITRHVIKLNYKDRLQRYDIQVEGRERISIQSN